MYLRNISCRVRKTPYMMARGNVICTTVICTNAKKVQKTGLCTIAFRGDVISTNKYGDRPGNKYYDECIHWIIYYHLPRTGICTTY
jgi:hypothetical protein